MGDRGNIVIEHRGERIYLYTHWGGSEIVQVAQTALAKKWRWTDPEYLARIVFDVLTEGQHGEETGFGIGTSAPDNEHPFVVINTTRQVIYADDPDRGKFDEVFFKEFIETGILPGWIDDEDFEA